MFAKPYKLKSNTTLKNSEKRQLLQEIHLVFPFLSQDNLKDLVPNKSTVSCMKLILSSGETVMVHVVDSIPIMIQTEEFMFPTICSLWKVPELLPTLTIQAPVLEKLRKGASLFTPGLILPAEGRGFPLFSVGTIVSVRTHDNATSALIGKTTMSSADMLLKGSGMCMESLHIIGDQLCKDPKFSKIERPKLGPAGPELNGFSINLISADFSQMNLQQPIKEAWPALGAPEKVARNNLPAVIVENSPSLVTNVEDQTADQNETVLDDTIDEPAIDIPSDMDGLLRWCLLSFLKLRGKSVELPLKTNLLYKNHLFPLCPEGLTLDVKKSSYKKMSKFLEAMQQEGFVEVRELEKGVDAIVAVNILNEAVRRHKIPEGVGECPVQSSETRSEIDYQPPVVREMFCVTAAVQPLLTDLRKGTPIPAGDVRIALTEYVRAKSLQNKGTVLLDETLAKITGKKAQEIIKWEELSAVVVGKMTPCTELRFSDGEVKLIKSRLDPITMQVQTRSGNKKVTLVSNLEPFGLSVIELSRVCQAGAAASCGVTRSHSSKGNQLMLQGDQTHYVAKLLVEKYGLPKKFVDGADKALKKKK